MSQQMLKQAKEAGIHELLHIPIILVMTVVVFLEENSLPKSKTGLYETIFRLIMDRTTLKTMNCTSADIPNLEDLLYSLGKLSWKALQNKVQQLLLKKVRFSLAAEHYYRPQTKLREGNVFTSVCYSVHMEGVHPPRQRQPP